MDETADGYAYRCVPLSVANAQGWEILSPVTVAARWSGGAGIRDISITFPEGTGTLPAHFVESHFGRGVITFNPLLIFRTPPGYDLWISGTPNDAKDAIAPLTAVVEADWMPFTFSMNWRFTRKNQWVRFSKGEPFCFFMPLKRQPVEEFAPQLKPLSADPDLMRTYAEARDQREDGMFSDKTTERFQGWYSRGLHPTSGEPFPDHRTRTRPRPLERS
jgi:hypothetical protein